MTSDRRPHSITVALTDAQMKTLESVVLAMHESAPGGSVDEFINSLVGCAIADAAEALFLSVRPCRAL